MEALQLPPPKRAHAERVRMMVDEALLRHIDRLSDVIDGWKSLAATAVAEAQRRGLVEDRRRKPR